MNGRAMALFGLFLPAVVSAELTSNGLDKTQYTSDFMIGNVVVDVIFTESDGSTDPDLESWTDDRKAQVLSEIMSGLDWWTRQNTKSPLSFSFISETIPTQYEPITRSYAGEALWVPDVLTKKGYTTGSRFEMARDYVNDLRAAHHTDWGFLIFVVDSLNDLNGKFADGYFAYAYLGGPYLVMTYDNDGYGINNMDVVAAHETGHIFYALDEYAGASSPYDYSSGYFVTINGNQAYSPIANEPNSIMRGGIRWGLSSWARQMIGWRDSNKDGIDDIVGQPVKIGLLSPSPDAKGTNAVFTGDASVQVLPRQGNPDGFGLTVDTIAKVEYRIEGDEWINANPMDGQFDSADESFQVLIDGSLYPAAQAVTAHDVDVRVWTAFALAAGAAGSGFGPPADFLADAHPYPNPFKPNSGLGHVNVTFTNLTEGSKVQIFSPAGEPVFEEQTPAGSGTLQWAATNDDGESLSSGVYLYLISDGAGRRKKGKIAIIR